MNKLWGDITPDKELEKFCVGDDLAVDTKLLPHDIKATLAHVQMLASLNLLSKNELADIENGLNELSKIVNKKGFKIPEKYEDGHSFIEFELHKSCNKLARKIHFLRSRNDQSLTMIRLFMQQKLELMTTKTASVIEALAEQSKIHKSQKMPGYTHMQKAMPTTVGAWLGSYLDALEDSLILQEATKHILDQNPLGSGAGFGFDGQKLQPNKEFTAKKLNFSEVQQNPMYAGLSRGYFEIILLQNLEPLVLLASSFASDLLLYTTVEFNFFSLPVSFTTGSSIMPQKHNYDVLEIMRGKESIYWGYVEQIHGIIEKKTSGYQRDLQLAKKPLIEAIQLVEDVLNIWEKVVENLEVNKKSLDKAMTPELHATEKVNNSVAAGGSFRDEYMKVKKEYLK